MDEDNGKELGRGLVGVAGSGPPFAIRTITHTLLDTISSPGM